MEIEVLVCTLSGEQRLERRTVPEDWFVEPQLDRGNEI